MRYAGDDVKLIVSLITGRLTNAYIHTQAQTIEWGEGTTE